MAQRVLALAGKLMAPPLPRAPLPVQLGAVTAASSAPTGLGRDPARTPATRGYVQVGPASPPLIKARTPTLASNLPRPPLEIDPVGTGANLDQTPPPRLEVDPAADQAAIPPRPAATTDAIAPGGQRLAVAPARPHRRPTAGIWPAVAAAVKGNPSSMAPPGRIREGGGTLALMATLLRSGAIPHPGLLVRRRGSGSSAARRRGRGATGKGRRARGAGAASLAGGPGECQGTPPGERGRPGPRAERKTPAVPGEKAGERPGSLACASSRLPMR